MQYLTNFRSAWSLRTAYRQTLDIVACRSYLLVFTWTSNLYSPLSLTQLWLCSCEVWTRLTLSHPESPAPIFLTLIPSQVNTHTGGTDQIWRFRFYIAQLEICFLKTWSRAQWATLGLHLCNISRTTHADIPRDYQDIRTIHQWWVLMLPLIVIFSRLYLQDRTIVSNFVLHSA